MPSVPREKYLEMNWRAADKVAAWKLFKQRMNVIFVADQIPEERHWALILVAGGDEAYNCWDTLEDNVEDRKKVDQVWDAFEKSFKQSTSFWHFRDAWQTSDKTNQRQWLIWISASSRLSAGANGRRSPKRSERSTCCIMPPSTTRYISLFKSQNLPH